MTQSVSEDNEEQYNDALPSDAIGGTPINLGTLGWLRWMWRQLTTMRVALQLLFLLAIAAVPGSIFPQRLQSPMKVSQYLSEHAAIGPFLDRIGMFDVYGSPWFSAIYLLLMTSLVGCIIPRARVHWNASRSLPPVAPRNLTRLKHSDAFSVGSSVADVSARLLPAIEANLVSKRWRVHRSDLSNDVALSGYVSAERGFMRETGNLIFHIAVIVILLAVAAGSMFGYRGQIIVRENTSVSNVLAQYDSFTAGRLFSPNNLVPFTIKLTALDVTYETEGKQVGAARDYRANIVYRELPTSPLQQKVIGVNNPLDIGGASMFLVGHGYAPHFVVKDREGRVVFDDTVVFLPQDQNFSSNGVVKVPDMTPQLGLQAIFAPTGVVTKTRGPHSLFPSLIDPKVYMSAWTGDLGLDGGVAQNVYELDKQKLQRIGFKEISPGETWKLPGGVGSVTLVDVAEFATFNIAADPAQNWALLGAILAILGVTGSLYIKRRRVWVRVVDRNGVTTVEIGALSRYEDADVASVVTYVSDFCREQLDVAISAPTSNKEPAANGD